MIDFWYIVVLGSWLCFFFLIIIPVLNMYNRRRLLNVMMVSIIILWSRSIYRLLFLWFYSNSEYWWLLTSCNIIWVITHGTDLIFSIFLAIFVPDSELRTTWLNYFIVWTIIARSWNYFILILPSSFRHSFIYSIRLYNYLIWCV